MADLKATSFRISEDDLEKFKQFMEQQGIKTQADGFKSIMQSVEMAKAKNMITSRSKEIETFQETINNLMGYFINSLNVNQTSEERIREELSKELQTKDNTITTMYDQLQEIKNENKELDRINNNYKGSDDILREEIKKLNNDIIDKQKNIDKLNSNNDLLQENLKEYKQYKDNYKKLEDEFAQSKADQQVLKDNNNKLNNDNKQLNDKIKNDSDMLDFYKNNIAELKENIEQYKLDNKALESKFSKEISDIKADHAKALEKELKANAEQLQSKNNIEVAKKDLEIQKLKNEIEQFKKSSPRASTPKTK